MNKTLPIDQANSRRVALTTGTGALVAPAPSPSDRLEYGAADACEVSVRALEECIDAFENEPRPFSTSLA